jgi:phosphoribosylformylglycinamidine cyclo-ligase
MIGEVLLTPTRIYVKEVLELFKKVEVHGLAHITGGGLRNFPRLNKKVRFVFVAPFDPQPVFSFLQKYGNIREKEMYQTFNMGMGFAIILPEKEVDEAISILKKYSGANVKVVGKIEKGIGVEVPKLGLKF